MDLSKKLKMLTGDTSIESDVDLVGVEDYKNPKSNIKKVSEQEVIEKEDDFVIPSISINKYLSETGYVPKSSLAESKKRKNIFDSIEIEAENKSTADRILEQAKRVSDITMEKQALAFDSFLDVDSEEEEMNSDLYNNIVGMGRKYARDSAISKESSEISKTFADSEKRLKNLYEEIERDKSGLQKDIERARIPQRGNSKSLSDMISAKNSLLSSQLSIIKEINTIKKVTYELRAKEAAKKEADGASSTDINSNTLQAIFSGARQQMVNGMGGYSEVSGSSNSVYLDDEAPLEPSNSFSISNDDETIHKKYFKDYQESDGDRFLKYENAGVEYVLLINDEDKIVDVIAEDNNGNIVYDYPMPNNLKQLSFSIDSSTQTATDNLHRNYKVRRN